MKKTLSVLAVAAMLVLSFAACVPTEKTTADLLASPKNGWILSAATSAPGYVMESGEIIENLMEGYLYEEEMNDVISFTTDLIQTVKPGDDSLAAYSANCSLVTLEDGHEYIKMQVPFFYDDELELCRIVNLTEEEFKISCTINDDEPGAKGTYTFSLTYVPAK